MFALLLIDDHPVVLSGLRLLLAGSDRYEIVGEAHTVQAALAAAEAIQPDIIVTDLALGDHDRIAFIEQLSMAAPRARLLVYSSADERVWAERALRAGARGYVSKAEPLDTVARAIDAVVGGAIYLTDAAVICAVASPAADIALLSARERHILNLMASGRSRRSLSLELGLSAKTIGTYRERMKIKLGLDTVRALERFAIEYAARREDAA